MKKIIITALIILALGLVASKTIFSKKNENPFTDHTKVKIGDIRDVISASGKIQSDSVATLKFQTSGLLTYVGVKKGDIVEKGQLIASLDERELQKNLKKQLNDYMTSRWTLDEDKQVTYKDRALSDTIKRLIDKDQFSLENDILDVELADIALKFAHIYSPINGIVTDIDAPSPGVNVTAATATFTVIDYNDIYFKIDVDEADIGRIEMGQPVDIRLDAYPTETFFGAISSIDFTSSVTSGGSTAFPIKVKFPDNSYLKFKIGMNGDSEIKINEIKNTRVLPTEFIFENKKGKFVYVEDKNNTLKKREITTGLENETTIEILSGLKKGETVFLPKNI